MRVPKVTRTILSTVATVMMVNTETKDVFEQNVTLPRTYKDDSKVLKTVKALFADEPIEPVSILSTHVEETLYGMTEADFIRYAQKLPPRPNKNN